jgi:hypothetical protein
MLDSRAIRLLLWTCLFGGAAVLNAQIGGRNTYEFLDLPASARLTGLGGSLITVVDDDLGLAFQNPAALNPSMHGQITLQNAFWFAKSNLSHVAYAHHVDTLRTTFFGGLQFLDYGKFVAADAIGTQQGEFRANDFAFHVGAGRKLGGRTSVGATLKVIGSRLESYHSYGLALDLAATYHDTAKRVVFSAVLRNVGAQLSTYAGTREPLPTDLQIGFSKKLKYLPFRFSVIAHHLTRWNIRYDDPNAPQPTSLLGGEPPADKPFAEFVDNFFRHFVFSGEFLLGKRENLRIRFGYSHLRRAELTVPDTRSMGGISFGFGLKIKKFRLDYGFAGYHLGGAVNHLGLALDVH